MSDFTIIMNKTSHKSKHSLLGCSPLSKPVFSKEQSSINIVKERFSLSADLTDNHNGNIYLEENDDPHNKSFLVSFGWCYRRGHEANQFKEQDMIEFLQSHRSQAIPDVDALSGIFSLLSYDHLSQTLWICTDMLAQHGFYYGSNANKVVVSSKASIVADALGASIDGISYLSLLRDTGIPPGRSLYCDVWRATCGRGLHLDIKNGTARLVQMQQLYQPPENISFKEAVDQLIEVLVRVCPSAASGSLTAVDLTGGNDSRLMAAALSLSQSGQIGKQVTFKVVGDESHPDVIVARQIAGSFGWTLLRDDRTTDEDYSAKSLMNASILSDGSYLPTNVHRRLTQESVRWGSVDRLVGSLGGELFRDFFWRHEFLSMGRTNRVNFDALLKYRLHASNDVDVTHISDGHLTRNDHNWALLKPYQMIASAAPDILNVYKLDIIYAHKLMSRSYCWILSDLRKVILPFLSHEITQVSMRMPWQFRAHRKLVTAAVERMNPVLSLMPTDSGAPMMPLRFSSLRHYAKYTTNDVLMAFKRVFNGVGTVKQQRSRFITSQWLDLLRQGPLIKGNHNIRSSIREFNVKSDGQLFSPMEYQEIQVLLLVQLLTQRYKGISPLLSFTGRDANFTETSCTL